MLKFNTKIGPPYCPTTPSTVAAKNIIPSQRELTYHLRLEGWQLPQRGEGEGLQVLYCTQTIQPIPP